MSEPNAVTKALSAEFVRVRNKLEGAASRLDHARQQADIEQASMVTLQSDLDLLGKALVAFGGDIPPIEKPPASMVRSVA